MEEFYKQMLMLAFALFTGGGLTHIIRESSCQGWIAGYRLRFQVKEVDTGEDLDGDGKNDVERKFELGVTKLDRPSIK
tara:strand:+ start:369 stop:602 length:234 start_codon:yes stop_codon:yes gene_type:complete